MCNPPYVWIVPWSILYQNYSLNLNAESDFFLTWRDELEVSVFEAYQKSQHHIVEIQDFVKLARFSSGYFSANFGKVVKASY